MQILLIVEEMTDHPESPLDAAWIDSSQLYRRGAKPQSRKSIQEVLPG